MIPVSSNKERLVGFSYHPAFAQAAGNVLFLNISPPVLQVSALSKNLPAVPAIATGADNTFMYQI